MKIRKSDRIYIGVGLLVFVSLIVWGLSSSYSKPSNSSISSSSNQVSPTSEATEAKAEVVKTSWTAFTDSIDINWAIVTGIIQNTGKANIKLEDASGTVYDAEGKVVGNSTDSIYPRILAPNEKAYVTVKIMDTATEDEIKDAKVQISFDETDEEPVKLNAINDSGKRTSYAYEVVGELENTSDKEIEDARALVLFFDKENNLINTEVAYPTPETIPPQGTVAFKASTSHLDEIVTSYKVIGFSMQWGF